MTMTNNCDAMADVFRTCFAEDPNFTIMGNEVFGIGPQRHQFEPLQEEFADRIYYPPISEAAGAAMCGHRMFLHIGVAASPIRRCRRSPTKSPPPTFPPAAG